MDNSGPDCDPASLAVKGCSSVTTDMILTAKWVPLFISSRGQVIKISHSRR